MRRQALHASIAPLVFLAGFALAIVAWRYTDGIIDAARQGRMDRWTAIAESEIRRRLEAQVDILEGVRGFFRSSHEVERGEWRTYFENLAQRERYGEEPPLPIGFAERMRARDLAARVRAIRAEGIAGFTVTPPGAREEYFPLVYVAPFDSRTLRALGYDLASEPIRREALERAVRDDRPAATGRIDLVEDPSGVSIPAFLIVLPLYRTDAPVTTPGDRRAALQGFIVGAYRVRNLLSGLLDGEASIDIELYDGTHPSPGNRLYDRNQGIGGAAAAAGLARTVRFDVAGRPWTLIVKPGQRFAAPTERFGAAAILLAGFAMSTLLFFVARFLVAARETSETRYRRVVENIPSVVWVADEEGRTVYISPNVERVFGYSHSEIEAAGADLWFGRIHPDDRTRVQAAYGALFATGRFEIEYRIRRRDGVWIWLFDRAVSVYWENGRRLAYGLFDDVSTLKEAQAEAADAQARFIEAQKMEAVGRLSGGVAHDFNNILTAIRANAEIVRDDLPAGSPMRDDVEDILVAADRAAALTAQLLAFSRKQALEPRLLHPNAIVADIEKMLHRLIGEDIVLRSDLRPGVGMIRADRGRIEQVLLNLAVNARDAMPHGGTLEIATGETEIGADRARVLAPGEDLAAGRYVMIAVRDTGVGMDAAIRTRIFEPFFTTKEKGKGTGLGLATVFGIVRQSGGAVEVESEPGRGSTFRVYLPRAADDAMDALPVTRAAVPAAAGRGRRILFLEDEAPVRRPLTRVLRRLGHEVVEAGDGAAAIRCVREAETSFDLLLSDVVLPGESGFEIARTIRAIRPDLPVVFISGYTDDEVRRAGDLPSGAVVLQKPFTSEMLGRAVRSAMGEGERSG